jgi:hypothetical protein
MQDLSRIFDDKLSGGISVDKQALDSLSYELRQRKYSSDTTLTIRNIHAPVSMVEAVMLSFFYPENILFGEKIWESSAGAVYKRSNVPIPEHAIVTRKFGSAGMVFAMYQNLGSINVPLVFANHTYRKDDRDRNGLYDFDVISPILSVDRFATTILSGSPRLFYPY